MYVKDFNLNKTEYRLKNEKRERKAIERLRDLKKNNNRIIVCI